MKKLFVFAFLLFFIFGVSFSQDAVNPVLVFDEAVNILAGEINSALNAKGADSVFIGQFTFQSSAPVFISYWINQLTDELVNIQGRRYRVSSAASAQDAAWTVAGEIVQIAGIFRVYTRLIRVSDRSIEGSFTSSFSRDARINEMFYGGGSLNGSSPALTGADPYERDDWVTPFFYELGTNPNAAVINRYLTEDDDDFFLIIPAMDGRLTIETTGSIDTYMFLYDYETEEELASDDDGGSSANARITYNVRAGVSYLVIVCGFSFSTTGPYGFRAYLAAREEGSSSFTNPISYQIGNSEDTAVILDRALEQGYEDFFILRPEISGRLTIETTGRTDTYMELFDSERTMLERNDDGGTNTNARIRYNVAAGSVYYAKVRGYNQNTAGRYGFRAFFPGSLLLPPDQYEPNDEPSLASVYEIGTEQRHTFHSADDVDWIIFHITNPGRYNISAGGVNSNRLDTYIELLDANLSRIAEDDDGGDSLSSLLSLNLTAGAYYLKIWCLDFEPDQEYILNISAAR
ncbi:MAG: hypothetical protein FWC21_05090 [Treponema sp.]|nr:hypothetical protein [Treponema sp.]